MIASISVFVFAFKNANIKDPELRRLSDSIIESQKREINQMKIMLKRMK
ncbi:DUF305 domain-containing protein [Flavobacterium sp. CLA17]|nr:DUF305 domain-containing protein [Flavobacterium sp. CLA17]